MTPQLWIGLGFAAGLVIFLMVSYFKEDRDTENQSNTLRFLMALCAGFSGGFFTGDALFKLDSEMSDGIKIALSGTAGCALFFTIWLTRQKKSEVPKLNDTFNFSINEGWTFEQTVKTIAKAAKGVASLDLFSPEELALQLSSSQLQSKSAKEAIEKLKFLNPNLPDYTVIFSDSIYTVNKVS